MVDHKAIAETLNEYMENTDSSYPRYETGGHGAFVERHGEFSHRPSVLGCGSAKEVLEEHGAVMVKSMYFEEEDFMRIWFQSIDHEVREVEKTITEEKEVYTL